MRRHGSWPSLVGVLGVIALSGCGIPNPDDQTSFPSVRAERVSAPPGSASVVRRYAIAARGSDSLTNYRRQCALSTGSLHAALIAAGPPNGAQLSAFSASHVRASVAVVSARAERNSRASVQFAVVLRERHVARHAIEQRTTKNLATLRRTRTGWRVNRFTELP